MVKVNKYSIYFSGTNREFINFIKTQMWMDIELKELLKIKSNYLEYQWSTVMHSYKQEKTLCPEKNFFPL